MNKKICLITGATSGIGYVTASALAGQNAEVIVIGRSVQKATETVKRIKTITGNECVSYLLADFSDLNQVRELVNIFREHYSHLDILINNAGAYFHRRHETASGVEKTFVVNHLSHFLLTNLLLEQLCQSESARIINVSSNAHRYDQMNFSDLGFKRFYFGFWAYARSKLANVLFTYELSRRLSATKVTVNTLHPGLIASDIWKTNFPVIGPFLKWLMGFFILTPEEGADNIIYLASATEVEGVTGKYFVKRQAVPSSPVTYDQAKAKRLWKISEEIASIIPSNLPS